MRVPVDAPPLRRARHGLVDSVPTYTDGRWENGVAFTPRGCNVVFGHAPGCPAESKSDFQECRLIESDPWLLETGLVWTTIDLMADPKGRVYESLDFGTSSVLERLMAVGIADVAEGTPIVPPAPTAVISVGGIQGRLMSGAVPPRTFLTSAEVDPGPYSPHEALGRVEAKMLDASDHVGQGGVIFMSPVHAVELTQVFDENEDGVLVTETTGSIVVVGNFPIGTIWGVPGEVHVYLGDIDVFQSFERTTNEIALRAERYALVCWNCDAFGAGVSNP